MDHKNLYLIIIPNIVLFIYLLGLKCGIYATCPNSNYSSSGWASGSPIKMELISIKPNSSIS